VGSQLGRVLSGILLQVFTGWIGFDIAFQYLSSTCIWHTGRADVITFGHRGLFMGVVDFISEILWLLLLLLG